MNAKNPVSPPPTPPAHPPSLPPLHTSTPLTMKHMYLFFCVFPETKRRLHTLLFMTAVQMLLQSWVHEFSSSNKPFVSFVNHDHVWMEVMWQRAPSAAAVVGLRWGFFFFVKFRHSSSPDQNAVVGAARTCLQLSCSYETAARAACGPMTERRGKIITAGKCKHSALRAIISDLLCVHQKFTPSVPVQGCNFPFIHINIPVNISPNPPVDVHRRSSTSLEPGRFRNKHGESCVA